MNYGLYTAYLGMRARMRSVETIANNLANASTTGFKAERLYYHAVESSGFVTPPNAPVANAPLGSELPTTNDPVWRTRTLGVVAGAMPDYGTGELRQTGRSLDVALQGDGFFTIQTPRGERYTRNGAFTLDANGQLVTLQGDLVVGEAGPITLPPGEISIEANGNISVAGRQQAQLKLVRFENPPAALTKEGDNLFASNGKEQPVAAPGTQVQQGMLEASNVNSVGEMAAMIQYNREFEALQRSITLQMDLRKIAGEIGKI